MLTDAEIDALTGQELDSAVAEFVMGWTWVQHIAEIAERHIALAKKYDTTYDNPRFLVPPPPNTNSERDRWYTLFFIPAAPDAPYHGPKGYDDVPDYSTDIAAAWRVVEKFDHYTITKYGDLYIQVEVEQLLNAVSRADTVPLAICRAALKAVNATAAR